MIEMGGALHTTPSSDLNSVIVKNVWAPEYKVWYMMFLFYVFILFLARIYTFLLFRLVGISFRPSLCFIHIPS